MKMSRNESEEGNVAESADRRQFLRNAVKIGGAAALLLTSASREVLARSLSLNERDLDAARRAQQVKGAPADPRRTKAEEVAAAYNGCDCSGCSGCTGSCSGCGDACTGCAGGCKGSCAGSCSGSK
jgi:hypothetical protein